MPTYTYETNEQPTVRVYNCSGDIAITGSDQATIEIDSDELPEQFHRSQGGIELNDVDSDLALRVPRGATVTIENADGDVQVRDVAQVQFINIAGDLLLQDIAGDVQLENVESDLNIERAERVEIRGTVSGDLRIVHAARAAVEHAEGDVRIENVPTVQLGHVAGDLRLTNGSERCDVGHVEGDVSSDDVQILIIGHVGGDLAAARIRELQAGMIEGDCAVNGEAVTLRLGNIGGDLAVKVTTGTLTMGNVQGDAALRGAFDQLTMGTVQGDLALHAQLAPGGTYRAHVAGDAAVQLGNDANLVLQGSVVGDIRGAGVRTDHPTSVRLVWGAGEATLQMSVIGDLAIQGPPPKEIAAGVDVGEGPEGGPGVFINGSLDLGGLGRDLADMGREIAASFGPRARAGRRGRTRVWQSGVGLDPQQRDQIRQQVRSAVEQARASVDRALREARITAPPTPPVAPPRPAAPPASTPPQQAAPPAPPPPPADPAVGATVPLQAQAATQDPAPDRDAERLAILRMVQEGTISPEEAEDLLAALEG